MKATNIQWDVDGEQEALQLPDEIDIPADIAAHIKHIDEIHPDHDILMGYDIGVQKKWWYGIENITFIFMGAWNDPYIGYKDYGINCHLIEDAMWDRYNDEYPAPDLQSQEYAQYSEEGFPEYMRSSKDDVFELLDDLIETLEDNISDYISEKTGFCHKGFSISA